MYLTLSSKTNTCSSVEFPFCLVDYHFLSLSVHRFTCYVHSKFINAPTHTHKWTHTHTHTLCTQLVIDHRIFRFPISLISTPISTDLLRFYLAVAGCYRILTRVQRMLMLSFVFNVIQVHTVRSVNFLFPSNHR